MEYNVRLEFDEPSREPGDDEITVTYMTAFAQFHPAVSRSTLGRVQVRITMQAESVGQAAILSDGLTTRWHTTVVALDVMSTTDFDKRNELTPVPELINASEAAEILGISAAAVGQKFTNGQLPGQRVGERTIVFARRDIEAAAEGRRAVIARVESGEVLDWATSIDEATAAIRNDPALYAREVVITETGWE